LARRRWAQPVPPELRLEPALAAAVRCVLMAAARLFRPRAAAEVERSFALTRAGCPLGVAVAASSGQAPASPAADRLKVEHRSKAQSLPGAWVCRQNLAAAEARAARSFAVALAQHWAAPVALAAAVAQRSGQTAALRAPETAEVAEARHAGAAEVAAQPDAGAAGAEEARHAGAAAEEEEEPRVAGVAAVAEVVAQPDAAAAVLQPAGAPDVRAQPRAARPSVAGLSFRLPAERLVPSARARFARATEGLRNAAP
jgi:hypothetical protein